MGLGKRKIGEGQQRPDMIVRIDFDSHRWPIGIDEQSIVFNCKNHRGGDGWAEVEWPDQSIARRGKANIASSSGVKFIDWASEALLLTLFVVESVLCYLGPPLT